MADKPSAYESPSRALIPFEYQSEIRQKREALRPQGVEAIETFDMGKLVTW